MSGVNLKGSRSQRGDVTVYMSLLLLTIMTSSAVVFSLILAKQIRLTENAVDSERAFYAAVAGLEEGLYRIYDLEAGGDIELMGSIVYPPQAGSSEEAVYTVRGRSIPTEGKFCMRSEGGYRRNERRLQLGPEECLP